MEFPVRIEGIRPDTDIVRIGFEMRFKAGDRPWLWRFSYSDGGLHEVQNGEGWLGTMVDRSIFEEIGNRVLTLSGTMTFALLAHPQAYPVPRDHQVVVPRIGVCSHSTDPLSIVCYTAFPQASLYLGKPGRGANWIVPRGFVGQAIPTASGFQPVTKFSSQLPFSDWNDIGDARLVSGQPLAQLTVPFEFREVKLADFIAR
jgi:hypothetical protein